jgi:hypothetical protein
LLSIYEKVGLDKLPVPKPPLSVEVEDGLSRKIMLTRIENPVHSHWHGSQRLARPPKCQKHEGYKNQSAVHVPT